MPAPRSELETPRFILRPLIEDDIAWLADLFIDPEVNRFLWDSGLSPEQAQHTAEAIVHLDQMKFWLGHWAILGKEDGLVHGWAELNKLRPWDGPSDEIALSYVLRRSSWGTGIATEAGGRLLKYAFDVRKLERVMAVTMSGNLASKRVLAKLGMQWVQQTTVDGGQLDYFRLDAPST